MGKGCREGLLGMADTPESRAGLWAGVKPTLSPQGAEQSCHRDPDRGRRPFSPQKSASVPSSHVHV